MRKRNKGFTLIELLAVIVILALIALIATSIILNIIKDAKRSATKDSAYGYIDAVEKYIVLAKTQTGGYKLELVPTEDKELTCETKEECIKDTGLIGEVNKTIKGTKPSKIKLIIKGSEVATGTEITVDGFSFTYDGKKLTEVGETKEEEKEEEKKEVYANGTAVFYNPETGLKCNESEAISKPGTKSGCMKWYVFNDKEGNATVNVILDHNTTAGVAYNSTGNNSEMKEVKIKLEEDTSTWKNTARLVTANEIAKITGNTVFDASKEKQSWFFLDSNNKTQIANSTNKSKYAWLFDYTNGCTAHGCNTSDSSTSGYWTSTTRTGTTNTAWSVNRSGSLGSSVVSNTGPGIRPVITISKSDIS